MYYTYTQSTLNTHTCIYIQYTDASTRGRAPEVSSYITPPYQLRVKARPSLLSCFS